MREGIAGRKRTGKGRAVVMTLIVVLAAVYFCAGTAMSRTDLSLQELEGYYREKEKALVTDVKEFLRGEGFENSGVMLTRVIESDGSREYTLTVHHGRIDRMAEENRLLLMDRLAEIVFEDEDSVFRHEFLINQ